eukprot:g1365.t1
MCERATQREANCHGTFAYSEIDGSCECCATVSGGVDDVVEHSNWTLYTYERAFFCDASVPPLNGTLGSCTASLAVDESCDFACEGELKLTASTSCVPTSGPFPRLLRGRCFASFDHIETAEVACTTGNVSDSNELTIGEGADVYVQFSLFDFCTQSGGSYDAVACAHTSQRVDMRLQIASDGSASDNIATLKFGSVDAVNPDVVDDPCAFWTSEGRRRLMNDVPPKTLDIIPNGTVDVDLSDVIGNALSRSGDGRVAVRINAVNITDSVSIVSDASNDTVADDDSPPSLLVAQSSDAADVTACVDSISGGTDNDQGGSLELCLRVSDCDARDCSTFDIAGLGLSGSPDALLSGLNKVEVESLSLSDNSLQMLTPSTFEGFSSLTTLRLERTGLQSLAARRFQHLESLRELHIPGCAHENASWCDTHNAMGANISADAFANLSQLVLLDLSSNEITSTPTTLFSPLMSLESLHMTNNSLDSSFVHESRFGSALLNLKELHLGRNRIESLTEASLRGLSSLEILDLNGNQINDLHSNAFATSSQLRSIWLDGNRLSQLPAGLFSGLSHLTQLYLFSNAFTSIPTLGGGMSSLTILNILNNSIREDISTIHDDAFSGSNLCEIKLTGNNIRSISARAFDGWTVGSHCTTGAEDDSSLRCTDFEDWTLTLRSSSGGEMNCDALRALDGSTRGRFLIEEGSAGLTPSEACCSLAGGGFENGRRLQMDAQASKRMFKAGFEESKSLLKTAYDDESLMSAAWHFEWTEVELHSEMAHGAAGRVWRGILHDKWAVAIKVMSDETGGAEKDDAEIRFLQRARHPRLVMFLGMGTNPAGHLFVVLELMEKGSLDRLLWTSRRSGSSDCDVSWVRRLQILNDVAEGMVYIHNVLGSVHRDLKSGNILLTRDEESEEILRAKIADFGMARLLSDETLAEASAKAKEMRAPTVNLDFFDDDDDDDDDEDDDNDDDDETTDGTATKDDSCAALSTGGSSAYASMTSQIGTPEYMAPELWDGTDGLDMRLSGQSTYSQAVDMYAFAVVMWESLHLEAPWSGKGPKEICTLVSKGERPSSSKHHGPDAPKGYVDLMRSAWNQNPDARPLFYPTVKRIEDMRVSLHHSAKTPDGPDASKEGISEIKFVADDDGVEMTALGPPGSS